MNARLGKLTLAHRIVDVRVRNGECQFMTKGDGLLQNNEY